MRSNETAVSGATAYSHSILQAVLMDASVRYVGSAHAETESLCLRLVCWHVPIISCKQAFAACGFHATSGRRDQGRVRASVNCDEPFGNCDRCSQYSKVVSVLNIYPRASVSLTSSSMHHLAAPHSCQLLHLACLRKPHFHRTSCHQERPQSPSDKACYRLLLRICDCH